MEDYASVKLRGEVIDEGLCSLCGGCAAGCPYLAQYNGRIVQLDRCTLSEGNCYQYCPRTYTDMDALSRRIFGQPFSEEDMGVVKDALLARATDTAVTQKVDDGGVVAALLSFALAEGLIDAAISTGMPGDKGAGAALARNVVSAISGDGAPVGLLARSKEELLQCAGADYLTARALPVLNSIPKESNERLGIVGLPCQVASVAKRKVSPPDNRVSIDNVKLVISLFCANKRWLEPGESRQAANKACSYCWDWTGELADISIGSGRAKFKEWNTVIVRTEAGAAIIQRARQKGAIEVQPLPQESLAMEKKASLDKKKRAVKNIVAKSGDRKNLLYFGIPQTLVTRLSS